MRTLASTSLLLIALASGQTASAYDKDAYCAVVSYCLNERVAGCPKAVDTSYMEEEEGYCDIVQETRKRGLPLRTGIGRAIYANLGKEHRLVYPVTGKLPLSKNTLLYVFNDLRFASHLVNAYQQTEYHVEYKRTDRTIFAGDNGDNLEGVFLQALKEQEGLRTTYFGRGAAEFFFFNFRGVAVIFMDFKDNPARELDYELRFLVFPSSELITSVLNFGLFKSAVVNTIQDVVLHVEDSSMRFAGGDTQPIYDYPFFSTPQGGRYLKEFAATIAGKSLQQCEQHPVSCGSLYQEVSSRQYKSPETRKVSLK